MAMVDSCQTHVMIESAVKNVRKTASEVFKSICVYGTASRRN